jgi:glycosyltransferase involved in cell wall biosynthesis
MKEPRVQITEQIDRAPGITDALVFRSKATFLQIRRAVREFKRDDIQRFPPADTLTGHPIVGESRTTLWTKSDDEEKVLIAGKIHNLRLAIRRLNGVEIAADRVFSFWKQIGRTSRSKGYVAGRELREGCLIPNTGGGLCQLSNALYDAALRAGFQIVERHPHTQVIPGSLAEIGRDATVFFNYVDLRFKSTHAFRIEAELTADNLIVRFRSARAVHGCPILLPPRTESRIEKSGKIESCLNCGTDECFRRVKVDTNKDGFGRTAYLLDEYWPEFNRYITATRRPGDILCIPLAGKRFGKANYAWNTDSFRTVKQNRLFVLRRSYKYRKLALQGASRQRVLLATNESLAQDYASLLDYDVTHVTLMQQLLPYLWREGHLGGRTFDVLMTALPLTTLQQRLDKAAALHPESHTLDDFRADGGLVEAENEALRQARKIITPHTEIAALYPGKAVLLNWSIPEMQIKPRRFVSVATLAFPASTVGRKGVYELRAALKGLNAQLTIIGPNLEGNDFWDGLHVEHLLGGEDWLRNASAVVLPAFIEHRPRRLLEAVARGVPVIASTACGLAHVRGVTNVQPGDIGSLRTEIEKVLSEANERRSDLS